MNSEQSAVKWRIISHGLAIFLFLLSFPFVVGAQRYGVSGEIGLTYTQDDYRSETTDTTTTSLEKRYKLDYRNFIYKPRLLTYFLSGTFVKEDRKSNDSEIETKSKNYNIRLDFLSGTPYPFSLWALKDINTSFSPGAGGGFLFVEQDIRIYGLDGMFDRRGLPRLKYSLRQEDRETTRQTELIDKRIRNLFLSLDQNWENTRAEFNYKYDSTLDKITLAEDQSHDFLIAGNTMKRLSPESNITANAEFHKNTLSEFTEIKGATFLEYRPSDRFRSNMNANYNHMSQPLGDGDNFSTGLNVTYRLSNRFRTSGNSSFVYNTGVFGESTSEQLGGSLGYFELIAKDLTLSANTSLDLGARQGEPFDRTTLGSVFSATLSKNFPAIRSGLSTGGSANYSTSSTGGESESYGLNLTASSQYIERLTAVSELRYSQERSTSEIVDSEAGASRSTKKIISDTILSYFMYFGWRARLDIKAGALIEQGTWDREFFYTDEILTYTFLRNLSMRASSRYQYEQHEDTPSSDSISFNVELNYRIRSIFVTLKYGWRKENSSTRTHTFLEIVRSF